VCSEFPEFQAISRDLEKARDEGNERASLALEALITKLSAQSALMLLLSMVWMQLYLQQV
jgi:hypothetical protein